MKTIATFVTILMLAAWTPVAIHAVPGNAVEFRIDGVTLNKVINAAAHEWEVAPAVLWTEYHDAELTVTHLQEQQYWVQSVAQGGGIIIDLEGDTL